MILDGVQLEGPPSCSPLEEMYRYAQTLGSRSSAWLEPDHVSVVAHDTLHEQLRGKACELQLEVYFNGANVFVFKEKSVYEQLAEVEP